MLRASISKRHQLTFITNMAEHSAAAAAAAAATTSSAAYQRGAPLPPGVGEGLIDSLSDEEEEEAEAQEEEEEAPAAEEEEEAEAEAEVEEGEGGEGQSLADESMQSAAAAPVKAGAAPGKKTSRASVKGPKVRGTTTLPISRVQRIIKVSSDSVLLIAAKCFSLDYVLLVCASLAAHQIDRFSDLSTRFPSYSSSGRPRCGHLQQRIDIPNQRRNSESLRASSHFLES